MHILLAIVIIILLVGAAAFRSAMVALAGTVVAVVVLGIAAFSVGLDPLTALISICVVALLGRGAYLAALALQRKHLSGR